MTMVQWSTTKRCPLDLEFTTRPEQVAAMIERTLQAGLPFRWFTADEEFGQNPGLRDYLENAAIAYVMAVPKNTQFTEPRKAKSGSTTTRFASTTPGTDTSPSP
jgi:SRSO17 transposase